VEESTCPGCGLKTLVTDDAHYDGYYHTSPECWQLYTKVLGAQFGNALLFGQAHQLTVDAYAVQHAGGQHPDKSVDIHLTGLYLVLEKGLEPPRVPKYLQRLSDSIEAWPHFPLPSFSGPLTIRDIARATSTQRHIELVRTWSIAVWEAWSRYHAEIAKLARRYLAAT